eukprot:1161694-Amphidinium_carterae.1
MQRVLPPTLRVPQMSINSARRSMPARPHSLNFRKTASSHAGRWSSQSLCCKTNSPSRCHHPLWGPS